MMFEPSMTVLTLRHPDGHTETATWTDRSEPVWDPPDKDYDQKLLRAEGELFPLEYYNDDDTGNYISLFCKLRAMIRYCEITGAKIVGVEMRDVFAGIVEAARDTLAVMRRRFPEHILVEDIVTRGEYRIDWPDPREAIV